ncbi:MAG TPA: hypothetical protein VFR02_00115 [bacterium]|nr:hypothetical protein [bacterium]
MAFTRRFLVEPDLESCLSLLREGFAFKAPQRPRLTALWRELLEGGHCITVAVDDRRRPAGGRLVGFGMSVFVTDAFARLLLAGEPFLSRAFLREWEAGRRPYLLKKEVAAANAGDGLNLMVLHYGWREKEMLPEELDRVRLMQTEAFIQQHAGFKVKEYLHEVFGPQLRDFVLSAGSVLRHDYAEPRWKAALKGLGPGDRPYLTGFRPEEVLARAGTAASLLQAKAAAPRFTLSPGEQDMLAKALQGETDPHLARSLGLSPWTIKKRWQSVYLKVDKADPDLLGGPKAAGRKHTDAQPQRRRYLLEYLRHHPEELRPHAPGRPRRG